MKKTIVAIACCLAGFFAFAGAPDVSPVQTEFRISVFAKFIRNVARERSVPLAKAADMLYDLGVRGFDAGPDEPDLEELCATRLKAINFYYFPDWFPGRNGYADKTSPAECLAMAERLGIPRIMVVPPDFTDGKDNPAEFDLTVAKMREFTAAAAEKGITVTVEDFGGTSNPCSYAKYLKRFLDEIPDLRFALDTGNLYYAGRGEDICGFLDYARGRIAHVHLKDQTAQNNRAYITLGEGAVPNEKIVRALSSSGFAGWYTLENPVGDTYGDTVRQVERLKTWLSGNATPRWRAAAEKLKDGETLEIPRGEYHFSPDGSCRMWLDPSNNGSGWKNVVFPLAGRRDVTIDGNGSLFVLHGRTFPFAVTNCRNVTLRDFTITTRYPSCAGFRVVKKDAKGFEIQLDEGVCPYRVVNGELEFILDGSVISTGTKFLSIHASEKIDIRFLLTPTTPSNPDKFPTSYSCGVPKDLGGGRIRFDYAGKKHRLLVEMPFAVGEHCVLSLECDRYRVAAFFQDTYGITVEDVAIRRFGGMGVVAQRSGDIRVSRLEALPEDGERVSTTADVMHFINCCGKVTIENSRSAYSLDDVLNIHGNYLKVDGADGNKVRIRSVHQQQRSFFPYRPGDTVEFSHGRTHEIVHSAKVVGFVPDGVDCHACVLEIDSASPAVKPGMLVENVTLCPNVTIRGNDFHHHPNMRLSGRGRYLIEKNRIGDSRTAMVILDLAEYWYESGRVFDMTVRDNDFENCNALGGKSFIDIGVSGWDKNAPKVHGTIRFENNRYVGVKERRWTVDGVKNFIPDLPDVPAKDRPRRLFVGISESCKTEVAGVPAAYARALERAGHVPVVICRGADTNALRELVRKLDAVVFSGGEDINPSRYGETRRRRCGRPRDWRDSFDFALMAACVAEKKPILGICRGAQLMNVFFGGTLYQDIPSEYNPAPGGTRCIHTSYAHVKGEDNLPVHEIAVEPDSRLAKVLGAGSCRVNSLHHQGVKKLAPGFRVTARASDGFVEAIEHSSYPAVGLQFHPEHVLPYRERRGFDALLNLEVYRNLAILLGVK